jgi:hypothetical protein
MFYITGCWDEDVLQVVLKYIVIGNAEIRQDLILNMIDGKNVQYVNKVIFSFIFACLMQCILGVNDRSFL